MSVLSVDFETRSLTDLRKCGVYKYVEDPSTDLWCMAYAFDDEEPRVWAPDTYCPGCDDHISCAPDPRLIDHVESGGEMRAWNAMFERIVWREILGPRYGFPVPKMEQWHCTAAEAAAMALPRMLKKAARVLNVKTQIADDKNHLIQQMAKPRKPTKKDPRVWWDDEPRRLKLYEHCKQDVRGEAAVYRRVRRLSEYERRVYLLDQTINDRGIMVDLPLVRAAQTLVQQALEQANSNLTELTEGSVTAVTQVQKLKGWLQERGVAIADLSKDTVRDTLRGELPALEREVIEIRSETAKSSTSKLAAMQNVACKDSRLRGLMLYHGAGTGRFSGKLVQPHNFPRAADPMSALAPVKNVERFIPDVLAGDAPMIALEHPVPQVIAVMLRSMLRAAPGYRFLSGDYAGIEARVVAWIAEQDDLVELFATGGKIYETMAAFIQTRKLGREVRPEEIGKDSPERQIGKNTVLGCGFGMGADKFIEQAWVQIGVLIPQEDGELAVSSYRELYSKIPQFWYAIERAAIAAVREPGKITTCGRRDMIKFVKRGQFLWCILPSGRALCYSLPRLERRRSEWKCKQCKGTGEIADPGMERCIQLYNDLNGISDQRQRDVLVKAAGQCSMCKGKGKVLGDYKITLTYASTDSQTKQWRRFAAYGGLLTENVVQAMARDIMVSAMLRLEEHGYPNVLNVHDEILAERAEGEGTLAEFHALMRIRPRWAYDLPIAVDGWEGLRYRK